MHYVCKNILTHEYRAFNIPLYEVFITIVTNYRQMKNHVIYFDLVE